jgi:oxygen-dependent protoporphyrinogen oxidase
MDAVSRRLARFSTLALAGSAYSGVGVPACIQSGQVAAQRILAQLNMAATCSESAQVRELSHVND